ncbi:DegT/DnrJ/EryC1/StrS family aminotransferase [Planctomycetota bacterium]
MKVPFLDLKAQYETIKDEIAAGLQAVMDKTAFAGGPFVAKFEEEFASYCNTKLAVGVGSGTEALWLALLGLGVGQGDEVITTANTFIATAEAISYCGAKPVFVDIDEKTFNMDSELVEAAITEKTKAIIPVHLYGQMADMDEIMKIAKAHKLFVIEDACQAHGGEYKGQRAGSIGDAGCFSFYPGKNLGAYGEAGAVVTNDQGLADRMKMLRDHGQREKYYHSKVGWNGRMDGIQGAVLSVKLKCLDKWNDGRRKNAELYRSLLEGVDAVATPVEADYARHVYHIYSVRVKNRKQFMDALAKDGVACGIHYPVPLHLQEAYGSLGYKKGDFPVTEKCSEEIVSLPMFAELTCEQIEYVVEKIKGNC